MAFKYLLAIAILLVVLGLAGWVVYFVDEQTDPPYGSPEASDSTG
ncbi:MAG TPA: hypothetical protein VJ906_02845 [Roseovarius sp.]|nr:hypothetical protein [Marivita sp.]HKL45160.1 hypothetical protein [Roseovarius sp.]